MFLRICCYLLLILSFIHSSYVIAANADPSEYFNTDDSRWNNLNDEQDDELTSLIPTISLSVNKDRLNPLLDSHLYSTTNQIKVSSHWQLSADIRFDNYITHSQSNPNDLSNESRFINQSAVNTSLILNDIGNNMSQPYSSNSNEDISIGTELSLHHLLNNRLIVGVNFQIIVQDETTSNAYKKDNELTSQQLNAFAKYQIRDNFDLHLDWRIRNTEQLKTSNSNDVSPAPTQPGDNDIYYHYLLFSMSYKM